MNPTVDFEKFRDEILSHPALSLEDDEGEIHRRPGRPPRPIYIPLPIKFAIASAMATSWMVLSIWLSLSWLHELGQLIGRPLAFYFVAFIAYIPGFMNAFLMVSLLLDRRPPRARAERLPGVTVLVPCYNEASAVADTIGSLARQRYPGEVEFLIIDDGSKDRTLEIARETVAALPPDRARLFQVLASERNAGKSAAMNRGLAMARYKLVASVVEIAGCCPAASSGSSRAISAIRRTRVPSPERSWFAIAKLDYPGSGVGLFPRHCAIKRMACITARPGAFPL